MRLTSSTRLLLWAALTTILALPIPSGFAQEAAPATPAENPAPAPAPVTLTDHQRGDLYMARKMYREAIDMYMKAMGGPQDYILWNKIGIAYHYMQDYRAAKRHYERALKVNPRYAEARNNLGALAYAQRNYRGAIREYQRALKLAPDSATIYSNLGTAYFARKRYEDAARAYQQALALDPNIFESRGTAGTILQERSIEERARFHYYLAKVYAESGMFERALINIRKSLEEGFKDKKKYMEEPAFAAMRDLPEFQELMAMEFRVL
jgi:tetratricopeptide (TPR) repeat protein